jgi:hypothetical protein
MYIDVNVTTKYGANIDWNNGPESCFLGGSKLGFVDDLE